MIELKHVDAGYGKQVRVHGVGVMFHQNELTAVVGLNDSGRNTMIKSVVGLSYIFSGTVLIQEENTDILSNKKVARLVSYLSQSQNPSAITAQRVVLYDRFSYQLYPRHYTDKDRQYVKDAMGKLDIWKLRHQCMANPSGGERQEMYLVMALASDTKGFLLDEPTTWLDICY